MIESKPHDKTLNDWAQNTLEAQYLISKLTVENQIVFDPMMGTGTTGIAFLKLKRQFLGTENSQQPRYSQILRHKLISHYNLIYRLYKFRKSMQW